MFQRSNDDTIWALKDVSFKACPEGCRRIQRGEVVGIPSQSQDRHWAQRRGEEHAYFDRWFDRLTTGLRAGSGGMYVRLAFAVAAYRPTATAISQDPEILL